MKKKLFVVALCLCLALCLAACGNQAAPDAAATPSTYTNLYTNMDLAAVLEAMSQYAGLCNVATVNADGTPNLAIFVPGVVDDSHIMFGWAENATKANVLRDKKAVITYDVADPTAESKEERHAGAVLKVELEEDAKVLEEIRANNESISDAYVILKIVEVLPIG